MGHANLVVLCSLRSWNNAPRPGNRCRFAIASTTPPVVDALRGLFTQDAQLVTLAGTFVGPDAIAGFYRDLAFTVDDLWPEPGPLLIDEDRVAVEIRLRMNDTMTLVGDFFTLAGDQISRLAVYNGPPTNNAAT